MIHPTPFPPQCQVPMKELQAPTARGSLGLTLKQTSQQTLCHKSRKLISMQSGESILVGCMTWSCQVCSPEKMRRLKSRVETTNIRDYTHMVTLTHRIGDGQTWEDAINRSGSNLNRFLTAMKRRYPCWRSIMWVREVGNKLNMCHFHVLIRSYFPKAVIKRVWCKASGGSYIVDIARIKRTDRAGYILKYMTKGAGGLPSEVVGQMKSKRRWSCTRNISKQMAKATVEKAREWLYVPGSVVDELQWLCYWLEHVVEKGHTGPAL